MANHKIKDPKAIVCIILFSINLVGFIMLFTMGGVFFAKEHPKVVNYANSMCQVYSRSVKTYQCTSRYFTYTCYGPKWDAYYGANRTIFAIVETDNRYRSYSEAYDKTNQYQTGSSYSCWYDTRHPTVAQWDKPSTTVPVILLACGGLSVLLTVMFFYLSMRLVKQEILQERHDNMQQSSYSTPYTKQ